MKRGPSDTIVGSSFLSKEAPLIAFARQESRRAPVSRNTLAGVAPPPNRLAGNAASGAATAGNAPPELGQGGPIAPADTRQDGAAGVAPDTRHATDGQLILAPGQRVAEHYEVGQIIGAGAMGIVYKARHVELGQFVALKVMRPDVARDSSTWRRFSREARALSALHNKHVVRVHDAGTLESGLRYLVMELLVGCSLRTLLDSGTRLPTPNVVDYATQVCSALADAHRANIIHRDIRPEHIFLAKYRAAEPTVKLIDFGTALFLDDAGQRTLTARAGATPDYLSPEQLRDPRGVDARSDLWGVGLLMYELLAGSVPWRGLNTAHVALQIAKAALPRIETLRPDLSPKLADVIHRCLQVEAVRRPSSADELCQLLEPFSSRHTGV